MTHRTLTLIGLLAGISGCATDQHAANIDCVQRPGCVSSFGDTGYGPVHSQVVAPNSSSPWQPFS